MGADSDRAAILARRRFFVASALAGIVAGGCDKKAEPCLSVTVVPREDAQASAASDAQPDAVAPPVEASEVVDAGRPHPCLSPRPCLKIAAPRDAARDRCDPPTYIDKHGLRRVKPDCL
jgi:hypothetical protein